MTPVRQTKFSIFYSDGRRYSYGNCLVACIASCLDLSIDEVPNIYTFYNLDGSESEIEKKMWFSIMNIWLEKKYGKQLKIYKDVDSLPIGYAIARGISMRDKPHTCIYSKSDESLESFFDPHPTDQFLKEINYFLRIETRS